MTLSYIVTFLAGGLFTLCVFALCCFSNYKPDFPPDSD